MFFSVKYSIRIAGKVYMPCICYTLTRFLELTVKDLEKQGKATIHDKMVFFQNGKIIEEKPVVKEQKVGRNDPCPCGSGKKYKNCCGRN